MNGATKLMLKLATGLSPVGRDKGGIWFERVEEHQGVDYTFYEKVNHRGDQIDMTFDKSVITKDNTAKGNISAKGKKIAK